MQHIFSSILTYAAAGVGDDDEEDEQNFEYLCIDCTKNKAM